MVKVPYLWTLSNGDPILAAANCNDCIFKKHHLFYSTAVSGARSSVGRILKQLIWHVSPPGGFQNGTSPG